MKKFKRLSALLIASIMTAGTVSSLSAGALAHFDSKEETDEFIENSYKVPADSFLTIHTVWYVSNRDYIAKSTKKGVFEYWILDGGYPDILSFDIDETVDEETLNKIIAGVCPDAEYIEIKSYDDNSTSVKIAGVDPNIHERFNVYEEMRKKDVTFERARILRDTLDKSYELTSFELKTCSSKPEKTLTPITEYSTAYREKINNYISENNLDWNVIEYPPADTIIISAGENLSAEETYKVAEQIYSDLGLIPIIAIPETANVSEDIVIDMHNNIDGDANDDKELSIADAVSIMQAVGNPDEYALTPQGKFNADISGNYDGLTNSDALAVQKKLLNLE